MAGLQTMSAVSMGSALFVILGAYSLQGSADPSRVAAQIVTGVGFLGAGVIIKQGVSVTRFNTAAALWGDLGGRCLGVVRSHCRHRQHPVGNCFLHPLGQWMDRPFAVPRESASAVRCVHAALWAALVSRIRAR
ncbi:putative membrane protein [Rhodococcus opacus]|uniref:Putative membrane protein n=1 Tax=Rhodococcus opacus TaxID=37919 RepID=A0A1B1KFB9_RHOOP|nr:MgtC/SapB family protein [Rhodococcus opacus]ANS31313.1 putative membrane protein [Rhodococcus opacus]